MKRWFSWYRLFLVGYAIALWLDWTEVVAARSLIRTAALVFMAGYVVALQIESVRANGWRGLLPVQMVVFAWKTCKVAWGLSQFLCYGLGAAVLFAGLAVLSRLTSVEVAKDEWIAAIRRTPIEDRDRFFWSYQVWSYKVLVRWDHEEASGAVEHYRSLTRRRREWVAQMNEGAGAHWR